MPVIKVGNERLKFPDTMNQTEIESAILERQLSQQLAESRRIGQEFEPTRTEAALRGASQGLTLGFGDELSAATGAVFGGGGEGTFSERYRRLRDAERGQQRLARERFPGTTIAAEIGGGLLTGGAGAGRAAAGQTLRQAVPRLAGVGAAEGGAIGAGLSEDDLTRGEVGGFAGDVATGAATGAALGAALPAAGAGLRRIFRRAGPVSREAREAQAARQVRDDMAADNLTVQQAEQALAENPNLVLADLGENLQQRLGALAQQPGTTAQRARELLEQRNIDQLDRLRPQFEEALGGQGVLDAIQASVDRTRAQAAPLYDTAYATELRGTARLQELMGRPAARTALRQARQMARDEGVDVTSRASNVRLMDYVQRALRDQEGTAARAGNSNLARVRGRLRGSILQEVDRQVPEFAAARRIAADEFGNRDALELGNRVFTEVTPALRQQVNDMAASEREHFRIGVFQKVIDMLGRKVETANLVQDFRKPKIREAMEIAFDNPALFREFQRTIGDERQMFETMRKALQGSPTASRQAFGGIADTAELAGSAALGPGLGATASRIGEGLITGTIQRLRAPGQRQRADAMGELLLGRTPDQTIQMLTQPPRVGGFTPPATPAATQQLTPELQQLLSGNGR